MKAWINEYEVPEEEVEKIFSTRDEHDRPGVRVPHFILQKAGYRRDFATDTDPAGLFIPLGQVGYTGIEEEETWIWHEDGEWHYAAWLCESVRRAHPIITAEGLAEAERLNGSGHPGWETIRKLRRRIAAGNA